MKRETLKVLQQFEEFLIKKKLSDLTVANYSSHVRHFYSFLEKNDIDIFSFTSDNVLEFIISLGNLAINSQLIILSSLYKLCEFLISKKYIEINPLITIERPKKPNHLPKALSESDINKFIKIPDIKTAIGRRDLTIFEVLIATGIRVSELIELTFDSWDKEQATLKILGKGKKERFVILSTRANNCLKDYIVTTRRYLNTEYYKSNYIFIPSNRKSEKLSRHSIWQRVAKYSKEGNFNKKITPHTFRHSFATILLNRGLDSRSLQLLLGHSSIATTQIYSNISDKLLEETFYKLRKIF